MLVSSMWWWCGGRSAQNWRSSARKMSTVQVGRMLYCSRKYKTCIRKVIVFNTGPIASRNVHPSCLCVNNIKIMWVQLSHSYPPDTRVCSGRHLTTTVSFFWLTSPQMWYTSSRQCLHVVKLCTSLGMVHMVLKSSERSCLLCCKCSCKKVKKQ